ncbi:hypothetical protein GOP47_0023944 [Adiantum capillus-veneris]|uniref:Uncharacterized protein n=1 Tax=Adiantum capillus-veneris TaxID=13818 RepID=A0A9D4U6L8_ADICA|nr:hypothetical protein GOP47_0023944 [Adiantum capillus-veneris]
MATSWASPDTAHLRNFSRDCIPPCLVMKVRIFSSLPDARFSKAFAACCPASSELHVSKAIRALMAPFSARALRMCSFCAKLHNVPAAATMPAAVPCLHSLTRREMAPF